MRSSVKKILCGALSAAVILSIAPYASADVIDSPYTNEFYNNNMENCKYIYQRKYTVLKDCDVVRSPLEKDAVMTVKAGDVIVLDYSYTDDNGNVWGSYFYDYTDTLYGWVPMENVELIYDRYSFDEDHSEEYAKYDGEFDDYKPEKQVVLWTYPNSGEISCICPAERWFTDPGYFLTVHENADNTWTDENGDKWIYFGYGFWAWVYLRDPDSESINGIQAEIPEHSAVSEQNMNILGDTDSRRESLESTLSPDTKNSYALPIGIAAAAAAVSGASLYLIRKKKK